jgi:hypothetical protein
LLIIEDVRIRLEFDATFPLPGTTPPLVPEEDDGPPGILVRGDDKWARDRNISDFFERESLVFIYVAMTSTAGRSFGVFERVLNLVDGTEYENDDDIIISSDEFPVVADKEAPDERLALLIPPG